MDKLSFYVKKKIVYVDVIKTKNKNMYLKVKNNQIVVLIPSFISQRQVKNFVGEHIEKFVEYIENTKKNELYSVKDKFLYLFGIKYSFDVLTGNKRNDMKMIGNKYYSETKAGTDDEIEDTIKDLLSKSLLSYIEKTHTKFEKQMDVPPHKVIVRFKTTTWGTNMINKQKISYSTRLAHYDTNVIDYVIIHELAHYLQPNHSSAFWNIVGSYVPNYKDMQKTLKSDTSNTEDI